MDNYLSSTYIYRQSRNRPWDQRNDPIMVGDLPLKRVDYLRKALDPNPAPSSQWDGDWADRSRYWKYQSAAKELQNLQVLLHLEAQEEYEIIAVGGNRYRYRRRGHDQTPFHEEIRANWEQFARVVGKKDELEDFEIKDIVLPPAPFFADNLAPSLEKSSLLRIDLINCNLTEFESVAKLLKNVPYLISLGLSRNEISSAADAKVLSTAPSTKYSPLLISPSVD